MQIIRPLTAAKICGIVKSKYKAVRIMKMITLVENTCGRENCAAEHEQALSAKAKFVQSKAQILETAKTALPELNATLTGLLDAMLA